jgi:hypothetical protein
MTKTLISRAFFALLVGFSLFGMRAMPNTSNIINSNLTIEKEPLFIAKTSDLNEVADDEYTIILCHFEEDLINVHNAETGTTNGGWNYETDTPLLGTSSVTLAGENRNTIRWGYTPDLTEGTAEVVFMPHEINTDTGADYIMQDSGGYWGVYLLDDGALKARHYDQSLTARDLTSTYILTPGQTYHIAYTWGSNGQQIWVDGVLVAENQAVTIAMHSSVSSYGIGNAHTTSSSHASWGTYDEFRVSTVQRTSFPDTGVFDDGTEFDDGAEFDDSAAVIVSYFENRLTDVHDHTASSNGMSYISPGINGVYSAVIEDNRDYTRWADATDYTQGTVECFFKPTVVPLNDSISYYILNGGDGTYPMIGVYMQNGYLQAYHYSANYETTPRLQSSTILEPGTLYHIAYSFGPSGTHLYINGVDENSSTDTRILHTGNLYIGIGKIYSLNPTTVFSAQGEYDLFRLSSVQRTIFPPISDFSVYVDTPLKNDNGIYWVLALIAGGGIIGLIALIKPKRKKIATTSFQQHTTERITQEQPWTTQITREEPLNENVKILRVDTLPRSRFCQWCGELVFVFEDGVNFCSSCGKKL